MSHERDEWLDRYFEGHLDEVARERLERELLNSAEARERFWQRADLEEMLESWGGRQRAEGVAPAPPAVRPRRRWAAAGWAAAVAILAVSLFRSGTDVSGGGSAETPETTRAGVVDAGVAFLYRLESPGAPYREGQTLAAGAEVTLDAGIMELDFYSGARVIVRGPARIVPVSDMELRVVEGGIEADVPESAIGFRVRLPDGVVTDFGTRFGVEVRDGRTSRVQVAEGEVGLEAAGVSSRLGQGEAVAVDEDAGLRPIEFRALEFRRSLASRLEERARRLRERWREHCERIEHDRSVLVHFRMEQPGSRRLVNHAAADAVPGSGTVIAAEWGEGRWKDKPALGFRRPADRVRVDLPGEFPQATFVAWTRIDDLPRRYNGLFLSEYGVAGEVHWQFSDDGRFLFGVRPRDAVGPARFHRAFSEPVLGPDDFGRWHMLATSYDAERREVVHFVDGREVGRTRLDDSVPLRFGRATLGNFHDPHASEHVASEELGEQWSFRNWTGSVDEFLLFARVLDTAEIRELYERGRVE